jgi:hypothetical protein
MIRTIGLILLFGPFFSADVSWAEKGFMTKEQMAADFAKRNLLTKDQAAALKSSPFLSANCTSEKPSSCRPVIDFAADCGVTASINEMNIEDVIKGKSRSFLINDVALLGTRVVQYPVALKAFGKLGPSAEQRLSALKQAYDETVIIANKKISPVKRLREAAPVLEKAEKISEDIASAAGFQYETGCGAGPEDSQTVEFAISERPKSAFYILQMDFDACKRVLADPYDPSQCDAWARIKAKNNDLSGNYRYRVTWSDGTVAEQSFKALSTGKKTIEINK